MDALTEKIFSLYEPSFTAMLIGLAFGCFLAGVATLQTFAFFWVNRRDPLGHKIFVGFLWLFDTLQIIFHAISVWDCIIKQSIPMLKTGFVNLPWEYRIQILMLFVVAAVTKILYLVRIWKVSVIRKKPPILASVLGFLLLVEFGFGLVSGYEIYTVKQMHLLPAVRLKWADFIAVALIGLNDVLLAAALVYSFVKSNISLSWTDSSTVMFCAYVLNTGFVVAVFSLIALIAFARDITSPVFATIVVILPQVYTNCFLAMMNARFFFQTFSKDHRLPRVFLPTDIELSVSHRFPGGDCERTTRMSNASSDAQLLTRQATINDIGLPLFPSQSPKDKLDETFPMPNVPLEVVVQRSEETNETRRKIWY